MAAPQLIALNKLGEIRNQDPTLFQVIQEVQQQTNDHILRQSKLVGLLRSNGDVVVAAEISGDGTTSASNALTVTKLNGTSLAALGTGILKNTTATGVPSIAIAADFPTLNQDTTGKAAKADALSTTGASVNVAAAAPPTVGQALVATDATHAAWQATASTVTDDTTTAATMYPAWVTANTGNLPIKVSSTKLSFRPDTGIFTATGFAGPLTGAVTGNAATATSAAKWTTARNLAGNSVDGSANATFANKFLVQGTADAGLSGPQFMGSLGTGIVKNTATTGVQSIAVAADFPTLNQDTTGLAAKATILATTRAINGVNFDGSAPITVTADASTLSGTTLKSTVLASSLTSVGTLAGLTVTAAPTFSALTSGYLPKAGTAGLMANSPVYTNGTNVGVGTTTLNSLVSANNPGFDATTYPGYYFTGYQSSNSAPVPLFHIQSTWGLSRTANVFKVNSHDGDAGFNILANGTVGVGGTPNTAFQVGGATSALNSPIQWSSGTTPLAVPGVIFTQTASVTVSNTTAETSLVSTGVGSATLPAGFMVAGRTIRVTVGGSIINSGTDILTLRLKIGGTAWHSTGAVTPSTTAGLFSARGVFTCRTTGAGGTGYGVVDGRGGYTGTTFNFQGGSSTTIDTTGPLAIDVTAQWSAAAAGDSIAATNLMIEVLN